MRRTTKKKPPPRARRNPDELEEPVGPIRPKGSKGRNPVEVRRVVGDVVYQLERIRCGTQTCRCMRSDDPGNWHGPYWYAYLPARKGGGKANAGGRWVSKYIGREFRELD